MHTTVAERPPYYPRRHILPSYHSFKGAMINNKRRVLTCTDAHWPLTQVSAKLGLCDNVLMSKQLLSPE